MAAGAQELQVGGQDHWWIQPTSLWGGGPARPFDKKLLSGGEGYAPPGFMTLSCVKVGEQEGDLHYLDPRGTWEVNTYYRPPPEYSR